MNVPTIANFLCHITVVLDATKVTVATWRLNYDVLITFRSEGVA